MKIESANIKLSSQHQLQKQQETKESLRFWKTARPAPTTPQLQDQLKISETAQAIQTSKTSVDPSSSLDANQSLMAMIISKLMKALTGDELKIFAPEDLQNIFSDSGIVSIEYQASAPPAQTSTNSPGFGLVYERSTTTSESEATSFSADGIIKTQDGQEINFSARLNMSREFISQTNLRMTAGEPEKKDPLVVNFNGKAAELSSTRFEFDIDSDGSPDQIALLKSDSGYLALDKNSDGKINNGSELFGTKTGQGFNELAAYDEDKNNFIDENDAIYQKLRIWQRHEDGSEQLVALGDKNIGAIYLGHTTTPFKLKDTGNQTLGEVTSTGVYVTEQGQVGSIQQIDLSV